MNTLQFLVQTIVGLYTIVLLLRVWLQWCHVDFYNPFSQTIVKLTQPVLAPLQKFIPTVANINVAALCVAFLINALKYPIIFGDTINSFFSWQIGVTSLLALIKTMGKIIFWIILIRAVMSWFTQGQHPLEYVLHQMSEPLLTPIRKLLPSTGMIDFAPMILAFALILGNSILLDLFGHLWLVA